LKKEREKPLRQYKEYSYQKKERRGHYRSFKEVLVFLFFRKEKFE